MFDFFSNHMGEVVKYLITVVPILLAIFWSNRKLHAELQHLRADIKKMCDKIDSICNRMDQIDQIDQTIRDFNTRTDNMYHLLMTHLMKDKAP